MDPLELRTAVVELTVPFHDVDMMKIVWHGHYIKYFEIARSELFSRAGVDLFDVVSRTGYVFPVIRSSVKHVRPLRYLDRFSCRATLTECRHKLVVEFEIRKLTDNSVCAHGFTEQVGLRPPDYVLDFHIPDEVREAFGYSNAAQAITSD